MMNMKGLLVVAALGVGVGLAVGCGGAPGVPGVPSVPSVPGTTTTTGADADSDGVPDNVDKCPDKKEDGLAPDPKDGCPKA